MSNWKKNLAEETLAFLDGGELARKAYRAGKIAEAQELARARVRDPVMKREADNAPKFTRAALIANHIPEWPSIERDIADAQRNGLALAAKAGDRGWLESAALNWARANRKLAAPEKPADSLSQAMRNLASSPGRKHTLKG